MKDKILVTGATGTIGKALVQSLKAQNIPFVAGVRNVAQAAASLALPADSVVHFDWQKPETFAAATENTDRVFLLGPPLVLDVDKIITPFIDFLKSKGITRVVYISALAADKMGDQLSFHTAMEEKLVRDGFDYTILKPSFFAQNFKNYEWDNITQRGVTYATAGEGKVGFVDVQDIADVAAAVLTKDGHSRKVYELTGPELLSYSDAARLLSGVTGKTIVYPAPSVEEYTNTLKAAGAPDFVAPYMTAVYSVIANGHVGYLTNDVEQVIGRKPGPLAHVLQRDFA
jgi:uncharacterized protein YbjT (DUF2867 family)